MAPAEWEEERAEVLKGLALFQQAIEGLRSDLAELQAGLAQMLSELKEQATARQKQIDGLLIEHAARCVVVDNLVEATKLLNASVEANAKAKASQEDVQALEKRIEAIEKLMPAVKVVMWVGALLGASIIALIWSLITGRAQIVFR